MKEPWYWKALGAWNWIAIALLLCFATVALGAAVTVQYPDADANSTGYFQQYSLLTSAPVVGSGGTAYSNAVDLNKALYFGAWVKCAGSSPDVKVDWLGSPTLVDTDFALSMEAATSHTGTSPLNYSVTAIPTRYGRMKLIGNAGNGAGTTCSVVLSIWGMR